MATSQNTAEGSTTAQDAEALTIAEAAKEAGRHPRTVYEWCKRGYFHSWRPVPFGGGKRYIDAADFRRFLRGEAA